MSSGPNVEQLCESQCLRGLKNGPKGVSIGKNFVFFF
jgi:hypothetical protein